VVISKSGGTTETLALFMTLLEMWPDFNHANRSLMITEASEENDLRRLALHLGSEVTDHSPSIGGRFSVFSIVGLLPALLNGADINSFVGGARRVIDEICAAPSIEASEHLCGIVRIGEILKERRVNQHVLFSFSDMMRDFGGWFIQLIGESLGKAEDFGITPINAIGTVDQHSLLQLVLGGPADKLFTIITQRNNVRPPKIATAIDSRIIGHLNGHDIHELMLCHQRATIDSLRTKGHVRVLEFDEINIGAIGELMALMFIEVIMIARLVGVNPFDQPAVEGSKKLVLSYLDSI
jgi:glucose-6-phosphate isomerase